jgi:hypothetical protein
VNNRYSDAPRKARTVLLVVGVAALGSTLAVADQASRRHVTPPAVPDLLKVEEGNEAYLVGHAIGTQNYVCLPAGNGFAWSLFTPEATLFDDDYRQIITHFNSPNPIEHGTIRPTWQDSRDTSAVWAKAEQSSTDAPFVEAGAVAWLLLNVKDTGAQVGPTGGHRLTNTTFIHRVNTHGGVAPATGCGQPSDVGSRRFVPYTADYFFYRKVAGGRDDN